ncbi:MAG: hypothetical protein V1904_01695 [Bacteroidota bacterium]
MSKQKMWVYKPAKRKTISNESEKNKIENYCQPLVEEFKKQYIKKNPDKRFNYMMDIYTKWKGNYFYFIQKYKSEHPDRTADEFEEKFVRLEYTGKDSFRFSYFRHTGQWFLVAVDLTLKDCLEMMRDNPSFQPIG